MIGDRLIVESENIVEAIDTIRIASIELGPGPQPFRLGTVDAVWCAPAGDPVIYLSRQTIQEVDVDAAIQLLGPRNKWRIVMVENPVAFEHILAEASRSRPLRTDGVAPIERYAWSILHLENERRGCHLRPPVGVPPLVPSVREDGSLEVLSFLAESKPIGIWAYVRMLDDAGFQQALTAMHDQEWSGMVLFPVNGLSLGQQRVIRERTDRILLA